MVTEASLRGTGRTLRMVGKLPASGDCVVVVHRQTMVRYIQEMIRDLFPVLLGGRQRFVVYERAEDIQRLRGIEGPVFVDHAVIDFGTAPFGELMQEVRRINARAKAARATAA